MRASVSLIKRSRITPHLALQCRRGAAAPYTHRASSLRYRCPCAIDLNRIARQHFGRKTELPNGRQHHSYQPPSDRRSQRRKTCPGRNH